jgi:hypothetical protein
MLKDNLGQNQKQFIELMANKFMNLNFYQINHFFKKLFEKQSKFINVTPLSIYPEWPDQSNFKSFPPSETNFTQHEELMKELTKWYQSQNPQFGIGDSQRAIPVAETEKKEQPKEKKEAPVKNIFYSFIKYLERHI